MTTPSGRALLLVSIVTCGCASAPPSGSTIRNSLCELGQSSDYVGRFEIVSLQSTLDQYGLTPTTLRVIAPIASRSPNDRTDRAGDAPIQNLRTANPGSEVAVRLALPEEAMLRTGSKVIVFLTWSSTFSTWADFNAQGVFFEQDGGWANRHRAAFSDAELVTEAVRGSSLPKDARCESGPIALPLDGGAERPDGGP